MSKIDPHAEYMQDSATRLPDGGMTSFVGWHTGEDEPDLRLAGALLMGATALGTATGIAYLVWSVLP